jgi:hypothetical protein
MKFKKIRTNSEKSEASNRLQMAGRWWRVPHSSRVLCG